MMRPGSHNQTIESLKDRVARDPFSRAFLQLAEEYRKEGRFQEAIAVCREGLQRHPTYHTARIALGRTQMEAGDLEAARATFTEVIDLQPENHLAAKLLAEIQKKTGDLTAAAETYGAILRYYPDDREVAALLQECTRQGPQGPAAAAPPSMVQAADAAKVSAPTVRVSAPFVPVEPAALPIAQAPDDSPFRLEETAPRPPDPSPDFLPEDFGGKAEAANREAWAPSVADTPVAWTGRRVEDRVHHEEDDALQTNTLAEVYLRQGLVDRAIEVYRGMLRVDPANRKAAARLSELSPGSPIGPVGAPTPPLTAPFSTATDSATAVTWSPPPTAVSVNLEPRVSAGEDGGRRQAIRRLERWLAQVSAGTARGATLE